MLGRCLIAFAFAAGDSIAQDLWLPRIFGDHMVLQRGAEPPIWGRARPGAEVSVRATWGAPVRRVVADDSGAFRLRLKTPTEPGPFEITITTEGETRVLRDVLLGEVWLCSGQSNMEWPLARTEDAQLGIERARRDVRLFEVHNTSSAVPLDDCDGAKWVVADASTVPPFSAVAFWFADELGRKLDAPIGLVEADWGGTRAEAWTSVPVLEELGIDLGVLPRLVRKSPAELQSENDAARARWRDVVDELAPHPSNGDPGDEAWVEGAVPGRFEQTAIGAHDGFVWYRRAVDVPAAWDGRDLVLELGAIDDVDDTWFAGRFVGHTAGYAEPRAYTVAGEHVRAGRHTLVVRVLDTGGPGGFLSPAPRISCPSLGASIGLAGVWQLRASTPLAELPDYPWPLRAHSNMAAGLFHGMIAPVVGYGMRGAIWYQGESNVGSARRYTELFPAMIRDWRTRWGRDFPFYFVQIAPFAYRGDRGESAELREAQLLAMRNMPNTGMVVTTDVGDPNDIHPAGKRTVGRRLAAWALARTHGFDVPCCGPVYTGMRVEGDRVRLFFDHVGEGLVARGDAGLTCFTIAGADRRFVAAEAVLDGDSVVVWSDAVPAPVAVRMGWGAADTPSLQNVDGFPASPFRTDDWPRVSRR